MFKVSPMIMPTEERGTITSPILICPPPPPPPPLGPPPPINGGCKTRGMPAENKPSTRVNLIHAGYQRHRSTAIRHAWRRVLISRYDTGHHILGRFHLHVDMTVEATRIRVNECTLSGSPIICNVLLPTPDCGASCTMFIRTPNRSCNQQRSISAQKRCAPAIVVSFRLLCR